MKIYRVYRKSDGALVYVYTNEFPVEWQGMEFSTHDHLEYLEPPNVQEPSTQDRRITKLAFRNRFTLTEKVTIELAAVDNPNSPMEQRQLSAALRANMADQRDATFIDLDDPVTRAGVQMLETYGLIQEGRALQILDDTILDGEKLKQEGVQDG